MIDLTKMSDEELQDLEDAINLEQQERVENSPDPIDAERKRVVGAIQGFFKRLGSVDKLEDMWK